MLTIALAVLVGLAVGLGLSLSDAMGYGWSTFFGVVAFGATQFGTGFFLQKKVKAVMMSVQEALVEGQKRLQAKTARWQMRQMCQPGSMNMKEVQREIDRNTREFVTEALRRVEPLKRFKLWVPLMDKQIATAQFQLHWMIKDFKAVDELMPKAIFLDPMSTAIKIARMYMTNASTADI